MELTSRLKALTVSVVIMLVAISLDSSVISAPVAVDHLHGNMVHIGTNVLCKTCDTFASTVQKLVESGVSETIIVNVAIEMCTELGIEDKYICEHIVPEFKNEVLTILSKTALSSDEICGAILYGIDCGSTYNPFHQKWTIPIPGNKPPVKVKTPNMTAPVDRILQVSDIHWDTDYTEGLTTQCGEPLCCRPPNHKADNHEDAAGPWGDAHCDIPYRTVINLMEQLRAIKDEFDWVYVTGDLPAHNDWTQTRDDQLNVLANISRLFKEYLPGKRVFFAIGNHESAPVNSFPPPYITGSHSEAWLYDKAADEWADWLTSDAVKTLKYGGFYSVEVRPDLKVISLQTNFCNEGNWWLLINSTDPGNMLIWLTNELLESEKINQKVHILGHIPPGSDDCDDSWTNAYVEITDRFRNIITGHFFGHVHIDSFRVLYNKYNNPIGTVYLSPSVTTYGSINPGYRLYDIEGTYKGSTRLTLDHRTYIMNITEANLSNKPKWFLEYSAKAAYNMTSLVDTEWDKVVDRLINGKKLFQTFYKYISKSYSMNECTGDCRCSKLRSLVLNRHINCPDSSDEGVRNYRRMHEMLC